MMTTDIYYAVPAEKPGYCLDPFQPLYDIYPQDLSDDSLDLYNEAMEIEHHGIKGDFQEDLDYWINNIKRDLLAYYKIGLAAWKLKFMKCWDKRFSSFTNFCECALGRSPASINNYIRAASIISRLIFLGFSKFPHSVSQCLTLYKLDDEVLGDTWKTILSKYQYSKITQQIIEEEMMPIDERPPQTKQIRIDLEQWQQIKELAAQSGLKPEKLIKQLLQSYLKNSQEKTEDEKESNSMELDKQADSEEDLEDLCTENIAQKDEHTTQGLEFGANLSLSSFDENDFSYYEDS